MEKKVELTEANIASFESKVNKYYAGSEDGFFSIDDFHGSYDPLAIFYAKSCSARVVEPSVVDSEHLLNQCESQIEKTLLAAVLISAFDHGYESVDFYSLPIETPLNSSKDLWIGCQEEVGKYRVDFKFVRKEYEPFSKGPNDFLKKEILVECDGHDFHERTKEQAKRDRSKDRFFQASGFQILRFTGSEIYNDPFKCAGEIFTFLAIKAVR